MHEFKAEHDLEQYVLQLAQEKEVGAEHRDHELARLRQVHRHELDREEAASQMAREMEAAAREMDKLVAKAEAAAKVRDIEREAEDKDVKTALGWRAEKDELDRKDRKENLRIEREDQVERAKALDGIDMPALIAATQDPARRGDLLRTYEALQHAELSTQQIQALKDSKEQLEKEYSERQRISDDFAERLERIMKSTLASVAEAAKGSGVSVVKQKL